MYKAPLIGRAHRITAADTTVIGNVSSTVATQPNLALIGIACNSTATGNTLVQVWAGTTATATVAAITGIITFASAKASRLPYIPLPAYCAGGAFVSVSGDNPDVTLFWNPC